MTTPLGAESEFAGAESEFAGSRAWQTPRAELENWKGVLLREV